MSTGYERDHLMCVLKAMSIAELALIFLENNIAVTTTSSPSTSMILAAHQTTLLTHTLWIYSINGSQTTQSHLIWHD